MDTIQKLKDECTSAKSSNSITKFGQYTVESFEGEGVFGNVFKVRNGIGRPYALKLCPVYTTFPSEERGLNVVYWEEIQTTATLNNNCIINILEGGMATFSDAQWIVDANPPKKPQTPGKDSITYFTMPYLPYSAEDVFRIAGGRNLDRKGPRGGAIKDSGLMLTNTKNRSQFLFSRLVENLTSAVDACHETSVAHGDIKADNVRYCPENERFLLSDFGQSHSLRNRLSSKRIATSAAEWMRDDMTALVRLFGEMFSLVESSYSAEQSSRMVQILDGFASELGTTELKAGAIHDKLRPYLSREGWTLVMKEGLSVLPSGKNNFTVDQSIRIPISGSVPTFAAARSIIDTPMFQRLRRIKQLGPTEYVFPGASHTRFEHSIGVFYMACRYLERLTSLTEFRACFNDLDEAVRYTMLAALVHDLGHYPFSHWVEELGDFGASLDLASHEDRAGNILREPRYRNIVENIWMCDVDRLTEIIRGSGTTSGDRIISTIISSSIDCDKLDYLLRDSNHCGVDYGKGIDLDRFISSLHVAPSQGTICLTDKAATAATGILNCRNTMYSDVYWHKTIRSCIGMFKRAFHEIVTNKFLSRAEIETLLSSTDESFIAKIHRALLDENSPLASLIEPFSSEIYDNEEGRCIYKVVHLYRKGDSKTSASLRNFFSRVFSAKSYLKILSLAEELRISLDELLDVKLESHEILIETTPKKDRADEKAMDDVPILDRDNGETLTLVSLSGVTEVLSGFLSNTRYAFILVAPRVAKKFDSISIAEWGEVFDGAVNRIIEKK